MPSPDLSIRETYLRSARLGRRLRIGVLIDGRGLERRYHEVLRDVCDASFTELVCVIERRRSGPNGIANASPWWARAGESAPAWRWRSALFGAYLRWIDTRCTRTPDPTELVDGTELLERVIATKEHSAGPDAPRWVAADDAAQIAHAELDVILRLCPATDVGREGLPARWGTWCFHDGDSDEYLGGSGWVWELLEDNPRTAVELVCDEPSARSRLQLAKVVARTSSSHYSAANRFAPAWLGEHLVIRTLKELFEHGWDFLERRAMLSMRVGRSQPRGGPPGNAAMLGWAARVLSRRFKRHAPVRPYWQIATRRSDVPLYMDCSAAQLRSFQPVANPEDGFRADPFLFGHAGRVWLFFEEYRYQTERGHIACAEVRADGSLGEVVPALRAAWHLSYPAIVRDGDSIYMVPESCEAGGVDLYRADEFPARWTRVKRILDFPAVDVTPYRGDDCWWLFVSPSIVPGHEHLLLLFRSQSIEGPWEEVAASPIVADPVGSRGAGALVADSARVIRPCQDCSVSYGGGLQFRALERLSAGDFSETVITRIGPDFAPGLSGIHSYARLGNVEAIDLRFEREPR